MFPSATAGAQGFLRVINHSRVEDYVSITARDESGAFHDLYMLVGSDETAYLNSDDLEFGNSAKDLLQGGGPGSDGWGPFEGTGPGSGDWHLYVSSLPEFEVLAYVRTADGFLTAMSDCVPRENDGAHHVATFNPARNADQVSLLRLLNPALNSHDHVAHITIITIRGLDDTGFMSDGVVQLSLGAGNARTITARELELGGASLERVSGPGQRQVAIDGGSQLRRHRGASRLRTGAS